MLLSIILFGLIQNMYLVVSIFILTKTEMTLPILGVVVAHIFFVFLLSFASVLMNSMMLKKAKYPSKTNYVGLGFSIGANALCLLLTAFLIIIRQRWFDLGYHFLSDNRAAIDCLLYHFCKI